MQKYKVVCLESCNRRPVDEAIIESELNAMSEEGWSLFQISADGAGEGSDAVNWVYLVFKR